MPNAKDFSPIRDGTMLSLVGVPKAGKTHHAKSAVRWANAHKRKAFAFLSIEELPGYAGLDVEYEVLADDGWRPSEGKFASASYDVLMKRLKAIESDPSYDGGVLILDTMNRGPSEAIWKWVMSGYNTDDPRKLGGNSRQPYVTYASRMEELMTRLALLRFRKKMHVVGLWHEDIREFEGLGAPRKETEKDKTVVRWDLARLPMMRGSMRQDIAGWFDFSFFVEPVVGSNPHRSRLVVVPPDQTRTIAGTRLEIVQELQKLGEVPNDFGKLLEVVEKHYGRKVA